MAETKKKKFLAEVVLLDVINHPEKFLPLSEKTLYENWELYRTIDKILITALIFFFLGHVSKHWIRRRCRF